MSFWRRLLLCLLSLTIATAIWLPSVRFFFAPDLDDYRSESPLPPKTAALARRHLDLWSGTELQREEIDAMRRSNPEWDFMGRTFLVMALANLAIREPENKTTYLKAIDRIIDDTLQIEAEEDSYYFLMSYARARPFLAQPVRSLFVDGEIAMMLASRQMVAPRESYRPLLATQIDAIVERMAAGPIHNAESYPDECWTFCNTMALAAVQLSDATDGRDHSEFTSKWVEAAKANLIDQESGLLISSFTLNGDAMDGPEGSSIFFIVHALSFVDEQFASDQYALARKELGATIQGFGYAREWPASWPNPADIDSGPIVPVLEASAGSSGLAVLGASTFDDEEYLRALLASLHFAAFPITEEGSLRFAASNQVGDAVLLYALVQGPVLERMQQRQLAVAEGGTP